MRALSGALFRLPRRQQPGFGAKWGGEREFEVGGKEKDKKLKEMQMLRLQGKLRDFIRIEKELRLKIKNV